MNDIYGCNDGITLELGLASSEDPDDFRVKLLSLEESWEDLAPGFYNWFSRHRGNQFCDSVIESALETSGITDLFYNNAIESLHSVLKAKISKKLSLLEVVTYIEEWWLSKDWRKLEVCTKLGSIVSVKHTNDSK